MEKPVLQLSCSDKTNRQYIYRWKNRYDGTLQSLADKSHRPHHHPNEHTEAELKLIADMRRRNPHAGLVLFRVKLMQRGYTRSITGLYRVLRRQGTVTETDIDESKIFSMNKVTVYIQNSSKTVITYKLNHLEKILK